MRKRFKRFILYLFIQYIPGTNTLAKNEAKSLARYVFDNFSEQDRLIVLNEMRNHLVDLISTQIKEKEHQIQQQEIEIKLLTKTLNKLNQK